MELLKERCRFVYFLFVRRHSFYGHRGSRYIDRTRGFSLMFFFSLCFFLLFAFYGRISRCIRAFSCNLYLLFSGFFGGSIFIRFAMHANYVSQ